ncbi:hypothetical protein B484DRAFT_406918, partial [Ochromonadaceae sp. CCMP2298]
DSHLLAASPHSFEFDAAGRVFALGCDSGEMREHWVTALQVARDNCLITQGAYRIQNRELSPKDVLKYAAEFAKRGSVFHRICIEDRRAATALSGLDLTDCKKVLEFLRLETLAGGNQDLLLGVATQLLLIPQGARGTWEAMHRGAKMVCEEGVRSSAGGQEAFAHTSVTQLLDAKAEAGGGAYSQQPY